MVTEEWSIKIIQDDNLLSGVAVEPFVLSLEVDRISECVSGMVGLASPRASPNPYASDIFRIDWLHCCQAEGMDGVVDAGVVLDGNESLVNCFFGAHFYELSVLPSSISTDVPSCWSDSVGPGTFYPGLFLVGVLISSVVELDSREVGLLAMFLEKAQSFLGTELDEVLDVRGTVLSAF